MRAHELYDVAIVAPVHRRTAALLRPESCCHPNYRCLWVCELSCAVLAYLYAGEVVLLLFVVPWL